MDFDISKKENEKIFTVHKDYFLLDNKSKIENLILLLQFVSVELSCLKSK